MTEIITFSQKIGTILFWIFLFMTILSNLIISVVLVPILLVMSELFLYANILFIGLTFGFLLNSILQSIEKLDKKHHLIAGVLIPTIALINIFIFTRLSNQLIEILELKTPIHNPLIIALLYVLAFTLPYLFSQVIRFKKK